MRHLIRRHSFLLLYTGNAASGDQEFRQLLRMVLPPAVKPGVMYCTWIPFLKRIQEKLILDLAEKAAGESIPETEYTDYDENYEETYDNPDGAYIDEDYDPDLDDWASGDAPE